MKKQVFGFASVTQYVNNSPGQISPVGELSTWCQTYSMTKGEFADDTYPGYTLTTFSVVDITNGVDQVLTQVEASLALEIANECVKYATTHAAPLDPIDFQNSIQATMFGKIKDLTMGALVQGAGIQLPAWYQYTEFAGEQNVVKIWLSDPFFNTEYPDYDLEIIPPHNDLNIFAGNWQTAADKLAEWPNSRLIEEMQVKKGNNPETYIRYFEFDFVNKNNPTQKTKTMWYVLVYGEAGNDDDTIKDGIIDKLVKETGKSSEFWEPIFPELFKRTEFIMYPRWDRNSVPNLSNLTALYSPFNDITNVSAYVRERCTFYPAAHFANNIFDMPLPYKSITINGVNGPNNIAEQSKLTTVWKDFINSDTSSPDFQRMDPLTQNWVHFMMRLVIAAESATSTSGLPQGFRRTRLGDKMYITGTYNKASYKAYARSNDLP